MEETKFSKNVDVFDSVTPEVKLRTKKMMMWIIIFAVVMLFGGVTSALIVLKGKLMWMHVLVPTSFWLSIVSVLLSSATMYWAVKSLKTGQVKNAMIGVALTLVFGVLFTITQMSGWAGLKEKGMGYTITQNEQGLKAYKWNPLGKFTGEYGVDYWIEYRNAPLVLWNGQFYAESDVNHTQPKTTEVMSTFNASGALISVLVYVHLIHLFFGLIYLVVNLNRLRIGALSQENYMSLYANGMYWHFMGVLWIYLFAFLFFVY
jgi:heme/copper-type cytochrome/quinol oxidase subunit 3